MTPVRVHGQRAFTEALEIVRAGRDVALPGQELTLSEEIALKDEAARHGALVLGPGGHPGELPEGRCGVVGVSAAATAKIVELLGVAGEGGRLLAVGSRDLSAAVCGRSTLQALAALDADPAIVLIIIAAEPPTPEVSALLREAARRLATPVVSAAPGEEESAVARLAS
jgi:succinyl-CoA synthetase alpha subunit